MCIDICAKLTIDELLPILNQLNIKVAYSNTKMGTLKLRYNNLSFEYATLRYEDYKKMGARTPHMVQFVDDIKIDAMRRDFTINTFALDKDDNFIDLLDSKRDLNYGLIRVVGNTEKKFLEDKTRIIRAIRFSCTLDFELDDEIKLFLKNKAHYLNEVPLEYIKKELTKIFESNNYDKFFE